MKAQKKPKCFAIGDEEWRLLRIEAARQNRTASSLVRELVLEFLKKRRTRVKRE